MIARAAMPSAGSGPASASALPAERTTQGHRARAGRPEAGRWPRPPGIWMARCVMTIAVVSSPTWRARRRRHPRALTRSRRCSRSSTRWWPRARSPRPRPAEARLSTQLTRISKRMRHGAQGRPSPLTSASTGAAIGSKQATDSLERREELGVGRALRGTPPPRAGRRPRARRAPSTSVSDSSKCRSPSSKGGGVQGSLRPMGSRRSSSPIRRRDAQRDPPALARHARQAQERVPAEGDRRVARHLRDGLEAFGAQPVLHGQLVREGEGSVVPVKASAKDERDRHAATCHPWLGNPCSRTPFSSRRAPDASTSRPRSSKRSALRRLAHGCSSGQPVQGSGRSARKSSPRWRSAATSMPSSGRTTASSSPATSAVEPRRLPGGDLAVVRQPLERLLGARRGVDGEQRPAAPTRVHGRVERRLRDEDRLAGTDREGVGVVDHLLAAAAQDVEDLVAVRVVVALVALARQQHDVHQAHRRARRCSRWPRAA